MEDPYLGVWGLESPAGSAPVASTGSFLASARVVGAVRFMLSRLATTMLLVGFLALGLPLLAGEASADPYTDCDYGAKVGGKFTGFCGTLDPLCGAVVVNDRTEAMIYGAC